MHHSKRSLLETLQKLPGPILFFILLTFMPARRRATGNVDSESPPILEKGWPTQETPQLIEEV